MNVKHARRLAAVKERIREEPRRFDMGKYVMESEDAPCGTAACIAGHLVWRSRSVESLRRIDLYEVFDMAMGLIGDGDGGRIDGGYFPYDEDLFFTDNWPDDLSRRYFDAPGGSSERVEVACEAIDRFLAERGFGPDGERWTGEEKVTSHP